MGHNSHTRIANCFNHIEIRPAGLDFYHLHPGLRDEFVCGIVIAANRSNFAILALGRRQIGNRNFGIPTSPSEK